MEKPSSKSNRVLRVCSHNSTSGVLASNIFAFQIYSVSDSELNGD